MARETSDEYNKMISEFTLEDVLLFEALGNLREHDLNAGPEFPLLSIARWRAMHEAKTIMIESENQALQDLKRRFPDGGAMDVLRDGNVPGLN